MKISRPRLVCALRAFFRFTGTAALAGSLALIALQSDLAWAAARSHTRHTATHPLSPSSFVETSSRMSPKRHKAGSREHSSAASSRKNGAFARPSRTSRSPHTRSRRQPEPADLVPMHRASRFSSRGRALYTGNTIPARHGRSGKYERDTVVAEVSGRSSNGVYLARLHTKDAGYGSSFAYRRAGRSSAPVVVASAPSPVRPYADARRTTPAPSQFRQPTDATIPLPQRPGVYAEGVSHPDDDERLPVRQPAPGQAQIGTAVAMAAPNSYAAPRVPSSQVVSGFGGEVAIASPGPTDRPGGTRRRDHPIPASALPVDDAPEPLQEREAIANAAVRPAVLPEIYDSSGRLVMPAPLKGSREVLVHQNTMATSEGLERIQDEAELDRLRADRQLVSFPESESLHVSEDLPYNRRCARPWAVLFAADLARDFYARFRQPLQVNSAVRTVSYQLRLARVNGNAAGIDGDSASPHLTGQAIDFGKRGMSNAQLAWMRAYLLPLMQAGKIDVEEEFQQACFHISVYRQYAYGRRPTHEYAQLNGSGTRSAAETSNTDQP